MKQFKLIGDEIHQIFSNEKDAMKAYRKEVRDIETYLGENEATLEEELTIKLLFRNLNEETGEKSKWIIFNECTFFIGDYVKDDDTEDADEDDDTEDTDEDNDPDETDEDDDQDDDTDDDQDDDGSKKDLDGLDADEDSIKKPSLGRGSNSSSKKALGSRL